MFQLTRLFAVDEAAAVDKTACWMFQLTRLFAVDEAAAVDKTAIYEDKSRLLNVSLIFFQ